VEAGHAASDQQRDNEQINGRWFNTMTTGPNFMRRFLQVLAASMFAIATATAATPPVDANELLAVGFKVLVATTSVQSDWVKRLPAGQIRPMQRTGKKFFIYPDAPRNQIYVGGPKEYEAYLQLHPDSKLAAREAVKKGNDYRSKQDQVMREANQRDLSDPFMGIGWPDLGW
jgi:hypothetical protein